MDQPTEPLVPKVHPVTRRIEPEDPMTLNATEVEGDPDLMVRAVVQEYSWIGWDPDQVLTLFRDPAYPVLHQLWRTLGDAEIAARIASIVNGVGTFRFRSTMIEAPGDPDSFPWDDDPGPIAAAANPPGRDPSFVSLEALIASPPKPRGGPR